MLTCNLTHVLEVRLWVLVMIVSFKIFAFSEVRVENHYKSFCLEDPQRLGAQSILPAKTEAMGTRQVFKIRVPFLLLQ